MSKNIVSVGLHIADNRVVNCEFDKLGTLVDGDIVLYQPSILSDWNTEDICEVINHWKNELLEAHNEGKTIIVYMPYPCQKYWDQEGKEKDLFYHLPVSFGFPYAPKEIKKVEVENSADFLREYWDLVGEISRGLLIFDKLSNGAKRILRPHTGNKAIGVLTQDEDKRLGDVLFIPPFIIKEGKIRVGRKEITAEVCNAIIGVDQKIKQLKNKKREEKIPEWIEQIKLSKEEEFEKKLEEMRGLIQDLEEQKTKMEQKKQECIKIKELLYAGGHGLEELVRDILRKLGFINVRSIRESEFEIDIVFEYEGRVFIGEVEGKDNVAINKDKVNQLVSNVAQFSEYEKDCIPDRGFLFGNGYRFTQPDKRGIGFTEGAIKVAKTLNCVLIETKHLYKIAKTIQEGADGEYRKKIRELILNAPSGMLEFPE